MKAVAGAALALATGTDAALSKCDVVSIIRAAGIPEAKVAAMTCTSFYESAWNPSATNHNSNGSTDFGLFQVNNNYWCSDPSHPGPGNGCKTTCAALFDPTANAECAAIILKQQGLKAWYGYRAHAATCNAYDISSCGGAASPSPAPAHDSTGGGASPTPASDSTGTGGGSSPIPASDSTGTGGGSPAPASDTTGTGGGGGGGGGTTTTGGHGGTTTGGTGGGGGGGGGTTTGAVSGRLSGKLSMKGLRK